MWDVFISHASEDKDSIVRPIAKELSLKGLKVWYDEFTLTLGDSLRRSIDVGIANSRFGIVVLSKHFFEKEWHKRELDGLVTREISGGKIILPIWHNVSREEVAKFSPVLADRIAISTSRGIKTVVKEILRAIGRSEGHKSIQKMSEHDINLKEIKIEAIAPFMKGKPRPASVDRKRALVHYNKGVDLMKRDNYQEAKSYFLRAIKLDSSIPEAHCNLGKIYLHEGDRVKAYDELQLSLKLNPNLYQAYLNLSRYYLKGDQYNQAEEHIKKVYELYPEEEDLLAEVAKFYFSLGRFREAITYFQRIVKINPRNFLAYYNLGNCYANLKENTNAIIMFRKAIEINQDFGMAWNNLGHTLSKEGEFEEAERILEIAKAKDPANYHPWFSEGHNYLTWGKLKKAEENFKKVTEIMPKFPGGWEGLGEVYEILRREKESIECFSRMGTLSEE